MTDLQEMPVFQKTYDLYKLLHEAVKKFPKSDRYSLGEKCKEIVLHLLEAIINAGNSKKEWKLAPLETALTKLELLKVFIRLAYETRCIPEKHYLNMQERIHEIGRMLGGWRRSIS